MLVTAVSKTLLAVVPHLCQKVGEKNHKIYRFVNIFYNMMKLFLKKHSYLFKNLFSLNDFNSAKIQ